MRRTIEVLALCVAVALVPIMALAHTAENPLQVDLIADGGSPATAVDAGDVLVWNDSSSLYVKYVADPNWCITATQLQVATSSGGIPQKNGNPIPGQFQNKTLHDCVSEYTYTISLISLPTTSPVYIAAHATVWDKDSQANVTVVSDTNTDITVVNGEVVTQQAVLAKEPFNYPTCSSYTADDTNKSLWDVQIGISAFNSFAATPTADWIWNTPDPVHPIEGDVVTFQSVFSVLGLPFSESLLITADNGYAAWLNGGFIGSAQLGPGFPDTLKEEVVPGFPQRGDWGVASQGWQTVELWPLGGIVSGLNTLEITAANEYMWNQDTYQGRDYYYGSYVPPGPPRIADPFPGTGLGGDNICRNPAGLIFKASVDYYSRSETGWGNGFAFGGSNWATYFTYDVQ